MALSDIAERDGRMKRDPSRPKAADIPDLEVLVAARDRGMGPLNRRYPYKVVQAKVDKLVKRGLLHVGPRLTLTEAGRLAIEAMEADRNRAKPDEVPAFIPAEEYDQDLDTQLEIEGGSMRQPTSRGGILWRRS
jgi:hypothetical protein